MTKAHTKREPHKVHLLLDQEAAATARRQAAKLFNRYAPDPIPADMVRSMELAFETAVRVALRDADVRGDRELILVRLCERHEQAFTATLRKLSREPRP